MPNDYDDELKAVGLRTRVMPDINSSGLAVGPVFPYDDRDTHLGDGVSIRQSDQDEIELYTEDDTHIYIRISDVLPNLVQWLADLPVEPSARHDQPPHTHAWQCIYYSCGCRYAECACGSRRVFKCSGGTAHQQRSTIAYPATELFAVAQEIECQAMELEAGGDNATFARRAAVAVGEEAIKRETKQTHQWQPGDSALYGHTRVNIGPIYERQLGDGSQWTALCYWMEGSHRVEKVLEIRELKPCT